MENQKTNTVLLVITIILLCFIAYLLFIQQSNKTKEADIINNPTQQVIPNGNQNTLPVQQTIPINNQSTLPTQQTTPTQNNIQAKTYTNTKYGFSFQYPNTWKQNGTELEQIDGSGKTLGVQVTFIDTTTNTNLSVTCNTLHGATLYNALLSDYNASEGWYTSGKQQITIAGTQALKSTVVLDKDGRGNAITPTQRVIIDFLNPTGVKNIELQFTTPVSQSTTTTTGLDQVVHSFTFL